MEAWLGKSQRMESYTSIYKLAGRITDIERDILFLHIIYTYAKGGCFLLKKRIRLTLLIGVLLCLIFACHRAGDYLRQGIWAGREASGTVTREENLVVLDAGHGGKDPGKVAVNGAEEKDINLKIALFAKEYLEAEGVEVVMTRTEDERLADTQAGDLKKRVSLMNSENPVLAVSIHQNSYHEEEVRGAQVFYYTESKEGEAAAACLQKALAELDPDHTKQIKANNTYYLLKKTEVPVVIAECGFLSNPEDARKLVTEEYQRETAEAVAKGVLQYIRSGDTGV